MYVRCPDRIGTLVSVAYLCVEFRPQNSVCLFLQFCWRCLDVQRPQKIRLFYNVYEIVMLAMCPSFELLKHMTDRHENWYMHCN